MLVYRLNRVPDKLHVALLELLGITLAPPAPAATEVRFRLAAAAVEPVPVPAWDTEVGTCARRATRRSCSRPSADFTIPALRPNAYLIEHDGVAHEIPIGSGVARPRGGDQAPFAAPPVPGDALYLGFDKSLARLVIARDGRVLAGPRRRRGSRGSAAAVGVLDRRGRTRLAGGDGARRPHRRLQLRQRRGRARAARRNRHGDGGRAQGALDPLPRRPVHQSRRSRLLHPAAGDLLDHGRGARRADPGDARHPAPGRAPRRERRHVRPDVPAALRPRALPHGRRDARGAAAPGRDLGAVAARRELRRELGRRPPLPARRRRRRGAPGDGRERGRRLVAAVRPGAAQGVAGAHVRIPQRRRPARQPRRRDALGAQVVDPRRGRRHQPGRGDRRRRRRDARRCPPPRPARAAHPLPRGHGGRLRGALRRGIAPGGAGVHDPARPRRRPGAGAAAADGRGLGAQAQRRGADPERGAARAGGRAPRPAADGRHPRRISPRCRCAA